MMLLPKARNADGSILTELTPLRKALEDSKSAFKLMVMLSFITNMLGIVPMLYMLHMYDRVLASRSMVTMASLLVIVIAVFLFHAGLNWIINRIMIRISLRIDWDLAAKAFDASFRRHAGNKKVNIQQVMGDLLTVRKFLTGSSAIQLIDTPFVIIYIIFGAFIHPLIALFTLVSVLIDLFIAFSNERIATPALKAANEANAEANRVAAQSLRASETAIAMGMLPALRKRWHDRHRVYLQNNVNGSEAMGLMTWFSGIFNMLKPSLQMALATGLAIHGYMTGGMIIVATFLIGRASGPLQSLIKNWNKIVNARLAFARLDQILVEDEKREQKMRLPAPIGKLSLTNVQGVPPGSNRIVVSGVEFTLPAGKTLAVVGPNAAGKSSLLRLILGVWRPAEGSVRLDGVEVSDWNHDELGPHIGYVPQDGDLFEATVAENIARLGAVDADAVVAAAQLAGIHEVILSFPDGYDTLLGEGGFKLSGGQAQRIAIARAFYKEPKMLVLDEPNASLDDPAEAALIAALQKLRAKGTTIVFTSHRPRLINMADFLLVLKNGNMVGFGPLREMLSIASEAKAGQVQNASALRDESSGRGPQPPAAVNEV